MVSIFGRQRTPLEQTLGFRINSGTAGASARGDKSTGDPDDPQNPFPGDDNTTPGPEDGGGPGPESPNAPPGGGQVIDLIPGPAQPPNSGTTTSSTAPPIPGSSFTGDEGGGEDDDPGPALPPVPKPPIPGATAPATAFQQGEAGLRPYRTPNFLEGRGVPTVREIFAAQASDDPRRRKRWYDLPGAIGRAMASRFTRA